MYWSNKYLHDRSMTLCSLQPKTSRGPAWRAINTVFPSIIGTLPQRYKFYFGCNFPASNELEQVVYYYNIFFPQHLQDQGRVREVVDEVLKATTVDLKLTEGKMVRPSNQKEVELFQSFDTNYILYVEFGTFTNDTNRSISKSFIVQNVTLFATKWSMFAQFLQ